MNRPLTEKDKVCNLVHVPEIGRIEASKSILLFSQPLYLSSSQHGCDLEEEEEEEEAVRSLMMEGRAPELVVQKTCRPWLSDGYSKIFWPFGLEGL